MLIRYLLLLLLAAPFCVYAQIPQPAYVPPPSAVSAGNMLQTLAGLLLVLATIGVIAWLFKRFVANPATAPGAIKVIAAAAVGQRERVVLVEVGGTWLVLGVAPGHVSALHSMPKDSADQFAGALPASSAGGFQAWLRQFMEKRNVR